MLGRAEVVGVSRKGVRLVEAIEDSRGAAIVDMMDVEGIVGQEVSRVSRLRYLARLKWSV